MPYVWLLPIGIALGAFGTLIGAGGGFLLVPVLLLLYPAESPATITSISLAVVFFNALSGSLAYARMGRVDYRSGFLFAAAAVPGAVAGALATSLLPRRAFDAIFGIALTLGALVLLANRPPAQADGWPLFRWRIERSLRETDGCAHAYAYDPVLGVLLSVAVGFLSSLLGIGGGILHVPALVFLLAFPAHIATATSHFILAWVALVGTAVHIASGTFTHGVRRTAILGLGVMLGAPLGARLSRQVAGSWILRGLALALAFVGLRILLEAF